MYNYLTITEAQQQLPDLADDFNCEPAIITKEGKPVMIAISCQQFESILETIEILSDREFMADLKEGIKQANSGKTINLEKINTDL